MNESDSDNAAVCRVIPGSQKKKSDNDNGSLDLSDN